VVSGARGRQDIDNGCWASHGFGWPVPACAVSGIVAQHPGVITDVRGTACGRSAAIPDDHHAPRGRCRPRRSCRPGACRRDCLGCRDGHSRTVIVDLTLTSFCDFGGPAHAVRSPCPRHRAVYRAAAGHTIHRRGPADAGAQRTGWAAAHLPNPAGSAATRPGPGPVPAAFPVCGTDGSAEPPAGYQLDGGEVQPPPGGTTLA
jgi:hypothetical protein